MQARTFKQSWLVSALAAVALVSMVTAFLLPVWWVSLTAVNYPPDAFPDGIRIHFQFNGVTNGCTTAPATSRVAQETQQEELGWRTESGAEPKAAEGGSKEAVLDCVHEMNTINHYVGMHPIGFGAPVEILMSKFIIGMLAVMLLGFAIPSVKARVVALGVGFAAVTVWMGVDLFLLGSLDHAIKQFIEESGKYFREAEKIARWGENVRVATYAVMTFMVAAMAFCTWASARWTGFQLTLAAIPAFLPVFFVGAFASWLYYFGHSLHPWGAFTVKPFMPTVFGDGKVAQFTTHSYPHLGFAFLGVMALALVVAIARRRVELMDGAAKA